MSKSRRQNELVVGTRGSQLARAQTNWVIERLRAAHAGLEVRAEIITTTGDRFQDRPLPEIGGKGLFTEELERALLDGSIDLAVHSAKDLPTDLADGLDVLAYPAREDPRDAWVSADGAPFDKLPPESVVGTTSLRRQAQLLHLRPDLRFVGLRGNVDTRIRKIHRGDCAGAVLAMAGLKRAGLEEHVTHPFDPQVCLPAPGQGALALEGRKGDERVVSLLAVVHDEATAAAVRSERAVLSMLDAGCRAPVAILAEVIAEPMSVSGPTSVSGSPSPLAKGGPRGILRCQALVLDPKGTRHVRAKAERPASQSDDLVADIVSQLRSGGGDEIIAKCRFDEGTRR
ncbi:MAG TPA: hydroxymethylbilane synthase [Phycisphaerae bacterium]|nr:hydroxymethylbilane synthase [Phycisphaerae bacterium]HRR84535.1 hydroxymethylbilane synthase [Phycisphaerae bacterium]